LRAKSKYQPPLAKWAKPFSFFISASRIAPDALTRERWLTDTGLRGYLCKQVPCYITHETDLKAARTPQAILNASGSFKIHHVAKKAAEPLDASLSSIKLRNTSVYRKRSANSPLRGWGIAQTRPSNCIRPDQPFAWN